MANHPNRNAYKIGEYKETADGRVWETVKALKATCDAQVEAEVRHIGESYPRDCHGLYIRRGKAEWFVRFGPHKTYG